MALSIAILVMAALLLLVFSLRSRYGLPLFLMTLGMCVASTAVLFQSFSPSGYKPPDAFPLRTLDLALYRYLGSLRVPLSAAHNLRLAGYLLYFAGTLLMIWLIFRNLKQTRFHRAFLIAAGLFSLLFIAGFTLFFSNGTAYRFYVKYCMLPPPEQERFRSAVLWLNRGMHILLCCFLLLPAVLLASRYIKRRTTYFADSFLLLTGIMLLCSAVFYYVFFSGIFAYSADAVWKSGFWYFSSVTSVPKRLIVLYPCFALMMLILFLSVGYRMFNGELVLLSRKHAMKKSIEELNRNLRDIFHSEKNLLFSILLLSREAKSLYGTPEGLEKLDRISAVAQDRMDSITSSLNRIRELHLNPKPVDMRTVMDQALNGMQLSGDITCIRRYCSFPACCLVDEYHTAAALKNLLANAAEALAVSGKPEKTITLTIDASLAQVCLSVRDNGTGIPRDQIRRVMLPFVSDKSKNANWGIGLPYAFRVINAQLGQMRIKSSQRPGHEYTAVDILLPRERS